MSLTAVIQVLAILGVPLLIVRFRERGPFRLIGTIGGAYVAGLAVALALFGLQRAGVGVALDGGVAEIAGFASIGLAIPLLLFPADMRAVRRLSRPVLVSFGVLTGSVVVVAALAFLVYGRRLADGAELSGMAVGLYTGGTPNLNAIGSLFGLARQTIAVANLSDMVIGGVFFLFLLTVCKPLLRHWLPAPSGAAYVTSPVTPSATPAAGAWPLVRNVLLAFAVAALGALIGVAVWAARGAVQGTMNDYLVPALMIVATLGGIALSFVPRVAAVRRSEDAGLYLVLVFSFSLAMSLDLGRLAGDFLPVFWLFTGITLGSFALHMALSRLVGTDVDCAMTTLTAGLYGPAFVPAVTKAVGNDALTAPGLICGSLGYAIGTFLGAAVGWLLS